MRLIFDIETDNYLELCTKIHCIVAESYDTGQVWKFKPDEIKEGLKLLQDADVLIGHNILDFDIRAIKKFYPKWDTKAKLYDTLVAAKFAFPDIKEKDFKRLGNVMRKPKSHQTDLDKLKLRNIGKHSLEAYGVRLGLHKGTFGKEVGFETYSEEMLEYCAQDVSVNARLYHKLLSMELDEEILEKEFEAQLICLEQSTFGFRFDHEAALKLEKQFKEEQEKLQDEIKSKLGGVFIIPLEIVTPKRSINYKDVTQASRTVGCPFTKIMVKDFNPTSRHDVTTRMIERYNWKPREFGKDGKPTLSEEVLVHCKLEVAEPLRKLFTLQKRMGMLSEGRNAWLKLYNEDTKAIHGRVDILGTATHRCTHSRPNLGQIPSVRSPYGKECRSLFTVPDGWKLFGTDAAGLELRMLAHYMAPFDGGAYADIILNGDIHTTNQEAAGLESRDMAKTFIYAKIYGSGIGGLAETCKTTTEEMHGIVKSFNENTPALKQLTDAVKAASTFRGYVKSLDGRRIPVKSQHSALNYLLQSSGAIVCKYWMVEFHRLVKKAGYVSGVDYKQSAFVHDELQWAFNPKTIEGELLGKLSRQAMVSTGEKLGVRIPLDIGYDIGDTYADTH